MAKKKTKTIQRKPRADAERNRERILQVAKLAFTRAGADISFRHFATREALLEAVYRTEVERLAAAEREFSVTLPPVDALRAWMLLFVDYIATKQLIAPAVNTLFEKPSKLFEPSGASIKRAINSLVQRAIESGAIRPDLDPIDLLRALVGVSNVASTPDWPESARRLVHILLAGSRPTSNDAAR
jgi:AcrR family transcriptional regulator